MKIDLHIHTTASDGRLTPAEVVARASRLGLKAIAITDHDSVEGIAEALDEAQKHPELLVIPGVEMGTDAPAGEIHILGYFIDHRSTELAVALRKLRDSRVDRGNAMISRLDRLGVQLDRGHVAGIAAGASVGRPHIAQAMVERGYVNSISEAFERYIGADGPAFVEREKLTPAETVRLINKTGGLAVLAHPASLEDLDSTISELKKEGLVGIEVHYKDYDQATVATLARAASIHGLIRCGGTDFHGFEASRLDIGQTDIPQDTVDRLLRLKELRSRSNT